MTWWAWTLLWVLLVVGAALVLGLVVRSLWRKGMALAQELAEASERLSVVSEELSTLATVVETTELAVFRDPLTLRQQRVLARRQARRASSRTDRAHGLPRADPVRRSMSATFRTGEDS